MSETQTEASTTQAAVDLTTCEREPIRIPGSVQPHGVLLVLSEQDLRVIQASENVNDVLRRSLEQVLGSTLADLLGPHVAAELATELRGSPQNERPALLRQLRLDIQGVSKTFEAIAHRTAAGITLELEEAPVADSPLGLYPNVDAFADRAERANSVSELSHIASEEIRRLTGFDRVLIYQFDETWNGIVVGEDGNGRLPALLDHRFPAFDIPAQARELYRINRLRLIPDAAYAPVPIVPPENPVTRAPLDMTFSVLRSVSPIHVEYMRNMETAASMSVSILRDGRLWGLISCHNRTPRLVPYSVRIACDLIARAFSLRLTALERAREYERRIEVRSAYSKLLAIMADRLDFSAALLENPTELLSVATAQGAAILTVAGCVCVGDAPAEDEILRVADWLFQNARGEVFATDSLPNVCPDTEGIKDQACGLLAISVSKLHPSYVLWFRPEVIRTVKWGGNPQKAADDVDSELRLHPRRSFATWLETVRLTSAPWATSEVEAAGELRNAIVGLVLRRAEEMAELNDELTRSNRELEAFSYSVSHDLRAPLRHVVGYAEMLRENAAGRLTEQDERCIRTIIESSEFAGMLVDKLLAFSRLGRGELQRVPVDMHQLIREVQRDVMLDAAGRDITWRIEPLPPADADLMMLRMALRNLLENAVKYTRGRSQAVIEVGSRHAGDENVYFVRDNGVGFDMQYVDKLFGVFQRLHRMEDYEGTGIGLANVRRVIGRHGGRTWAEGAEGRGATFYFSLPIAAQ